MLEIIDNLTRIEFWKYWPDEDRDSDHRHLTGAELDEFRRALLTAEESEWCGHDLVSPRFFVKFFGTPSDHPERGETHLDGGEVRKWFAFLGERCFYQPGTEVWNLLEQRLSGT